MFSMPTRFRALVLNVIQALRSWIPLQHRVFYLFCPLHFIVRHSYLIFRNVTYLSDGNDYL